MPATEDDASLETLILTGADALKSLDAEEGKVRVGAYAIRFADPGEKDLTGDYFTKSTDFGPRNGAGVSTMVNHGIPFGKGMEDICRQTYPEVQTRLDDVGLFVETTLDLSDKYQKAIAGLVQKGALNWSSGVAPHMILKAKDGMVKRWHPAEFSFTPIPAEPRLPAIAPLKSLALSEAAAKSLASAFQEDPALVANPAAVPVDKGGEAKPTPALLDPTFMTDAEKAAAEQKQKEDADKALKSLGDQRINDVNEMFVIGERFNCRDKAAEFAKGNKSLLEFNNYVLNDHLKPGKAIDFDAGFIGMNERETKRYSVLKACREMVAGGTLTGLEKEAHETACKSFKGEISGRGFIIPDDVFRLEFSSAMKAGNIMGSASQGGYLMQPELGPLIELLRNKPQLVAAGATTLSGLTGDMYLPRQLTGSTAAWLPETGTISDSNATFEQVKLSPKRLSNAIPYSTQFLAQTGMDAESVIRNDAILQMAIAKDFAGLLGTGVNGQPLGIANTPGINQTVTYGGAATWANVVLSESGVTGANADIGNMAWILDASTIGRWKSIQKATNYPSYLIADDGKTANGYPILRSNQVSGAHQSFFGVFAQAYLASWAGMQVIVDPYSLSTQAQVRVIFNEMCDICTRHPQSFNVSTDSAAQ